MQRKVFKLLATLGLAAAVVVGSAASSEAAFITGEINIGAAPGGGVSATGGTAWTNATGLDFVAATIGFYTGFEGVVTSGTGGFSAYTTAGVDMFDFTFDPFPVGGVTPLYSIGGISSFDLTSLTSVVQDGTTISLTGTGIFNFFGFDPTPGNFEFTSQTAGGTGPLFSFSSTQTVSSPEPATMGLFGLALLGLGGAVRRRFTA